MPSSNVSNGVACLIGMEIKSLGKNQNNERLPLSTVAEMDVQSDRVCVYSFPNSLVCMISLIAIPIVLIMFGRTIVDSYNSVYKT